MFCKLIRKHLKRTANGQAIWKTSFEHGNSHADELEEEPILSCSFFQTPTFLIQGVLSLLVSRTQVHTSKRKRPGKT